MEGKHNYIDSLTVAEDLCKNIFDFATTKKLVLKDGIVFSMRHCVPEVWQILSKSDLFELHMGKGVMQCRNLAS